MQVILVSKAGYGPMLAIDALLKCQLMIKSIFNKTDVSNFSTINVNA